MSSKSGIVVFERDEAGELTHIETLADYPMEDSATQLVWDQAGSALLVASCNGWTKFTPVDGGGIEYAGEVAGGPCPTEPLMIGGSFVHDIMEDVMIETYQFNDDRTELESIEQVMIDNVSEAAMTTDGSYVYAVALGATGSSLMAFERDAETGSLTMVSTVEEGSAFGEDDGVVEGLARSPCARRPFVTPFRAGWQGGCQYGRLRPCGSRLPAVPRQGQRLPAFRRRFLECGLPPHGGTA